MSVFVEHDAPVPIPIKSIVVRDFAGDELAIERNVGGGSLKVKITGGEYVALSGIDARELAAALAAWADGVDSQGA